MFLMNGKEIKKTATLINEKGDQFPPIAWMSRMEELGIIEVEDPIRPDDRVFYVTKNDDGSYKTILKPKDELNKKVWEKIKGKRDFHEFSGGVKVGDNWFHNDVTSKQKWDAMALKAYMDNSLNDDPYQILGQQVIWKTMSGSFVPVTADLISSVKRKFEEHVATVYVVAEQHKTAMLLLENPFEYDYLSGWPQTYQEWLDSQ